MLRHHGLNTNIPSNARKKWLVGGMLCVLAFFPLLPIFSILITSLDQMDECCALLSVTLPHYLLTSLWLLAGTALGVVLIGGFTAICITFFDFPGRRFLKWALVLPLAFPPYIIAFLYTDFLGDSGIETFLPFFPEIYSVFSASLVFSLVLYPYLYLLLRVSLLFQATALFEQARILGRKPFSAFLRVILPLSRPAIFSGLALALLEVLNDYGASSLFSLRTLSTGIYEIWWVSGRSDTANQIAAALLVIVVLLLFLNHYAKGAGRNHANIASRHGALQRFNLSPFLAFSVSFFCFLPLLAGFILPVLALIYLSGDIISGLSDFYSGVIWNSFALAFSASLFTVLVALFIAWTVRHFPGRFLPNFTLNILRLGYAIPGTMIAIGLLAPVSRFDNQLDFWLERFFGIDSGLLLSGGIGILLIAYLIRFFSPASLAIQARLDKTSPSIYDAAQILEKKYFRILRHIHIPLLQSGAMIAGLLVFVETTKELSTTLLLRPLGFDTLAVKIYEFAADELIEMASPGALVIVAMSLLPVILLSRVMEKEYPAKFPILKRIGNYPNKDLKGGFFIAIKRGGNP